MQEHCPRSLSSQYNEGPINCPHTFDLFVQLQCSHHLAASRGQVIIDERVAVAVDGAECLLFSHHFDLGVATHKPHDDRTFLHRARFLQAVADADVVFVDLHAHVACDGDPHILQKAFDKVPHRHLLNKLEASGVRREEHVSTRTYLTCRIQRVVVDGRASHEVRYSLAYPKTL